ncbi:MAG: cysteine hydrolase [Oculatellaceae cyanobacterium Prado106]|jgi:nicotinamidase-related amidase|nr:cysteine hydrolase [Oculatellaceae cyanobacterium Prado106]
MDFSQVQSEPYPWPYNGNWTSQNTALMIIDMQTDFCKPGGYCDQMGLDVSITGAAIAPTRKVLDAMRQKGFHIIHTREGHRPDLSDLNENKRWRSQRNGAEIGTVGVCGRLLTRGEPGWDIVPELAPLPSEPIIDKPGKGSFYATDLEQLLRRLEIRNLVFTGVTSDCCVHTTMRDANDRGYECLLLSDCSAALDPFNHHNILEITKKSHGQYGTVASSHELLAALHE